MTSKVFPGTVPALRMITFVTMCSWLCSSSRTSHVQLIIIVYLLILIFKKFPWVSCGQTSLAYHVLVLCPVTRFLGTAHCAATGSVLMVKIICSASWDFFVWFLGGKCRCFSIILREFWLTPWVVFSVPPAMEKRVLLNRRCRTELLICVCFLVPIVFQAKAF